MISIFQLIRIQLRNRYLGWTMQKLFLFLTLVSSLVRIAFFVVIPFTEKTGSVFFEASLEQPYFLILGDIPALLFFSTYTLLILFWAEILHHASTNSLSYTKKLRPTFACLNLIAYLTQFTIWFLVSIFGKTWKYEIDLADNVFDSIISILAAIGFIFYGGRLYLMLSRFPIESSGRKNKLREVGWVSVVCTLCFTGRAVFLGIASLDLILDQNWIFIGLYFIISELTPSTLVLFILRKPPPKRQNQEMLKNKQRFLATEDIDSNLESDSFNPSIQ